MEVPARVAFLNMKTGSVFFDCSPAEARIAVKAVEDMRKYGSTELEHQKKYAQGIAEVIEFATTTKPDDEVSETVCFIHIELMADMFGKVENTDYMVTHIVMNAKDYVDLRKWDRDSLDIETKKWKLMAGTMAMLWGAEIVVSRKCEEGHPIFCGMDGNGETDKPKLVRLNVTRDKSCGKPNRPSLSTLHDVIMEIHKMLKKLVN